MPKNKTQETRNSVADYIGKMGDESRRDDCQELIAIFTDETGFKPKMWGPSIVGFGSYHYRYDSGHEGDMCLAGFSSRSSALALYLGADTLGKTGLLDKLGKHKTTKGCLYIKKLADIDIKVLRKLITDSFIKMKKQHVDTKMKAKDSPTA